MAVTSILKDLGIFSRNGRRVLINDVKFKEARYLLKINFFV